MAGFILDCTVKGSGMACEVGRDESERPLWGQKLNHPMFDNGAFARLWTAADGSCFFHALASALNYGGYRDASRCQQTRLGRLLREKVTAPAHYDALLSTLDPSLRTVTDEAGEPLLPTPEQVRDHSFFAGDFLWRLAARALGITIVVMEGPTKVYVTPDQEEKRFPAVAMLGWIDRCHFEPVVLLEADADDVPLGLPAALARAGAVLGDPFLGDGAVRPCSSGQRGIFSRSSAVARRFLDLV